MSENDSNTLLKRAWLSRDRLYHQLFGPHAYTLPKKYEPPSDAVVASVNSAAEIAALAGKSLSEKDISIVSYAPNELRPYWIFASSGLSNPWFGQSEDVSGFGCELVIKTKTPGRWVLKLLRRLIYYIVSYSGTLSPGVSLQFDAPLFANGKSELSGIIVWYVDEAPDCIYELTSGQFGLFSVIGITADESELISKIDEYGCWFVQQILRETGNEQLSDPGRASITKNSDISSRLSSLRNYLENFGFSPGQTL